MPPDGRFRSRFEAGSRAVLIPPTLSDVFLPFDKSMAAVRRTGTRYAAMSAAPRVCWNSEPATLVLVGGRAPASESVLRSRVAEYRGK
jgi:hypothetical protein